MKNKSIYVTQPSLPPLEEFLPYIEKIWENKILTNHGPYHEEFTEALKDYLGVKEVVLFANATLALITALQSLDLKGEVITTPYTFIATSHSILWNKLTPVFVDIDPVTLNIDPQKVEAAITSNTSAILAVHCYGNPCDVQAIDTIAKRHSIKVIYDAAHAFSVEHEGRSLLNYGDLSVVSFHATKVFNTFEGGAIICHDETTKDKLKKLTNFGFVNEIEIDGLGLNAKMPEINAALGLMQLKYIDKFIAERSSIDMFYREGLKHVIGIHCLPKLHQSKKNYAYFPILINHQYSLKRDELYEKLKGNGYFVRRYFYPLTASFSVYEKYESASEKNHPKAHAISEKVICLPIYPTLSFEDIRVIIQLIVEG
jgi:dTDP-4-amino-4,6-dideoxygalactose transaminase